MTEIPKSPEQDISPLAEFFDVIDQQFADAIFDGKLELNLSHSKPNRLRLGDIRFKQVNRQKTDVFDKDSILFIQIDAELPLPGEATEPGQYIFTNHTVLILDPAENFRLQPLDQATSISFIDGELKKTIKKSDGIIATSTLLDDQIENLNFAIKNAETKTVI